jgi:hypothetical protein
MARHRHITRPDAGCLYGLNTQDDPGRASRLAWRAGGNDNGLSAALQPRRENRWRGERVHQAARETLSATLTPRTAVGSADGERCTG